MKKMIKSSEACNSNTLHTQASQLTTAVTQRKITTQLPNTSRNTIKDTINNTNHKQPQLSNTSIP